MRIKELDIKKYEVIREAKFTDLSDFVVVAGPNGVGKTKVKNFISHIFAHNGIPPSGSTVIIQATNAEEVTEWGATEVTLPHPTPAFSFFSRPRKKINTKARLINIDSARQLETVEFGQFNVSDIGAPEEEDADQTYSTGRVRDRFQTICKDIKRLKLKLLLDIANPLLGVPAGTSVTTIMPLDPLSLPPNTKTRQINF
jgi:hypothetical protein